MRLAQLIAEAGEQDAVIQVLSHLLSTDRTSVFMMREVSDDLAAETLSYIRRYQNGMPLAYLLGYAYFFNRKFYVNKNVLVPRLDTEVVVDLAEKKIIADSILRDTIGTYKILDLCCGSGIIGITLGYLIDWLVEREPSYRAEITASDISEKALAVAKRNAKEHCVPIHFIQSNLLEDINGRFDIIICNPPYVRSQDIGVDDPRTLKEPRIALDGGLDGLYYYRKILTNVRKNMHKDSIIIFEVGYDQADAVCEIAEQKGFNQVKVYKDLANNDRVVTIRW